MRMLARPNWKMATLSLFVLFVAVLSLLGTVLKFRQDIGRDLRDIKLNIEQNRERAFINRALGCLTLVIDNDRTFPLPPTCIEPEVSKYYPTQVCNEFQLLACGPKPSQGS